MCGGTATNTMNVFIIWLFAGSSQPWQIRYLLRLFRPLFFKRQILKIDLSWKYFLHTDPICDLFNYSEKSVLFKNSESKNFPISEFERIQSGSMYDNYNNTKTILLCLDSDKWFLSGSLPLNLLNSVWLILMGSQLD